MNGKTKLRSYAENLFQEILAKESVNKTGNLFKIGLISEFYFSSDLITKTFDLFIEKNDGDKKIDPTASLQKFFEFLDTLEFNDIKNLNVGMSKHDLLFLFDFDRNTR